MYKKIITIFLPLAFCLITPDSGFKERNFSEDDPDFLILDLANKNTSLNTLSSSVTSSDGFDNFYLGDAYAEPHLSQNPNNPLQYFVAFNYNEAWYTNDGINWNSVSPDFGVEVTADPLTAYDRSGNLYYQLLYLSSGDTKGTRLISSTNNGQSWSNSVTSVYGADKDWLAVDQTDGPYQNYLYSMMIDEAWDGVNFSRSTDGGFSWNQTRTFYYDTPQAGSMIAIGPNGIILVVVTHGNPFAETYEFYTSTDAGITWNYKSTNQFANYVGNGVGIKNSVDSMKTMPYPWIAADNSNGIYSGRLYLIYASNDPPGNGNKPDIFSRYSTDQGATWTSAIKVNDDQNTQNNNQYFPTIWCDRQTGRLFVTWMDTRDAPGADSAYIYASYSDDGGQTFAQNVRLSNQKMKINCPCGWGTGSPKYGGDYNSIVSINGQGLAAWGDYRNNTFGSYVAYFPDFAFKVSNSTTSILNTGSAINNINFPDILLYSNTVTVSATVSPSPSTGQILFSYPGGNSLNSFPGSVTLQANTTNVPNGNYTVTIKATGPNGIPVHQRSFTLQVTSATPVELVNFGGDFDGDKIKLKWETATEINNYGFDLEKSIDRINWNKIGFISGSGNSNSPKYYSLIDNEIQQNVTYYYRLKQIDSDAKFKYSNEIKINTNASVNTYLLAQNYPNPFNPETKIKYELPVAGFVSINLYDISGNEIKALVNEYKDKGSYSITVNVQGFSSGVYLYKMQIGSFSQTRKLLFLK